MRTSKIDLVFCAALVVSVLCGAVAFALPGPTPCGPQCKEVYLLYYCLSGNVHVGSKPRCDFCDNNACTVRGDTTLACNNAPDLMDVDAYANGVVACRACTPQDTYVEASLYQGGLVFSVQGIHRMKCQPKPGGEGPSGG